VRFNNAKELDGAIFCIGGVDNLIIKKKIKRRYEKTSFTPSFRLYATSLLFVQHIAQLRINGAGRRSGPAADVAIGSKEQHARCF
jgi:hypothetical protein